MDAVNVCAKFVMNGGVWLLARMPNGAAFICQASVIDAKAKALGCVVASFVIEELPWTIPPWKRKAAGAPRLEVVA